MVVKLIVQKRSSKKNSLKMTVWHCRLETIWHPPELVTASTGLLPI